MKKNKPRIRILSRKEMGETWGGIFEPMGDFAAVDGFKGIFAGHVQSRGPAWSPQGQVGTAFDSNGDGK